ncbi:alpha-L-rhamnosidase C-terminal domain-containing protein [Streptomyces sp. 7R007]
MRRRKRLPQTVPQTDPPHRLGRHTRDRHGITLRPPRRTTGPDPFPLSDVRLLESACRPRRRVDGRFGLVPHPCGLARTDWERGADGSRLTVDVPAGSTAEVHVPFSAGAPAADHGHRGGLPGRQRALDLPLHRRRGAGTGVTRGLLTPGRRRPG